MCKNVLLILGAFFILLSCSSSQKSSKQTSAVAQSPILKGELSPIDYLDTFKNSKEAQVKYVTVGKMMDSLEIKSVDNGRTLHLKPGEQFTPPKDKFTEGWVEPRKEFVRQFAKSKGIRVEVLYKKQKFYGVLEFNKVYEACAGHPSARSYFINLTDQDFANAKGGNTSVHYELYECAPRKGDKTVRDYTTATHRYTSWVLWLSDIKFE